jgi:simple sugar transport system substrate-binding protein
MSRSRTRVLATALIALATLILAACSSTGGKAAQQAGSGLAAGKASTPHYTFAMITHAAPGDTFWDIIRKGEAAAAC